ncbi:MAG: bifunctional precorrin-2 dehydrogenase/sirohydrochlorin ferrochelatase [Cytophagales bacterium]|nr:bifunctional precorrin-2 dehydrogenase/sirohydrochlorin ferrochelatase [Cytophagales bacterium]
MNTLFPIFLKLDAIQVLLVGGGNVGFEKLLAMLINSPKANITVVAPEILEELSEFAAEFPTVKIIQRKFEFSDMNGVQLIVCATDDKNLHKEIYSKAKEKGILINVADTPDICDFYLGSVVKKGDLKIAISTNGKSPTFAKRFREVLEETLPDNLPDLLNNLKNVRDTLSGDFKEKVDKLNELTSVLKVNSKSQTSTNERDYRTGTKAAV